MDHEVSTAGTMSSGTGEGGGDRAERRKIAGLRQHWEDGLAAADAEAAEAPTIPLAKVVTPAEEQDVHMTKAVEEDPKGPSLKRSLKYLSRTVELQTLAAEDPAAQVEREQRQKPRGELGSQHCMTARNKEEAENISSSEESQEVKSVKISSGEQEVYTWTPDSPAAEGLAQGTAALSTQVLSDKHQERQEAMLQESLRRREKASAGLDGSVEVAPSTDEQVRNMVQENNREVDEKERQEHFTRICIDERVKALREERRCPRRGGRQRWMISPSTGTSRSQR